MSRRSFLSAMGGAGAAAALSGCSTGKPRTEITFHQSKPEAIGYFKDLAGRFNASQSRIRVIHDSTSSLAGAFVRGNPPDIAALNYNLEMGRFMERGALSDLSDLPEASAIRDDVKQLADQYATYAGRTSVLPYSVTAASVIYNKAVFAHHSLEIPETWSDMIQLCETLADAGTTPIYGTYRDPWTVTQGLFDYTVGGMVDVQAFYRHMHDLGTAVGPESPVSFEKTLGEPVTRMTRLAAFSNANARSRGYGDGNTAMAKGKAAMIMQGPWAFGEIAKTNPSLDLGTFPLPMTDDPADRKIRVNIDLSLWIPEDSRQQEAAREFLSFLMKPEIQDAYNREFLGFGTRNDDDQKPDPRIAQMRGYYDDSRFYMGASQFIPRMIPAENYIQSIAVGAPVDPTLRALDQDWARLALRQ
ncbi:ABC transporter substrate-binding protein [Arthrobacter sp.]|uniref:ABC transporter substrate-binding protein n=1 Tax=Arthrobacter sp. TaxID=1667 RepID=UPI003A8CC247